MAISDVQFSHQKITYALIDVELRLTEASPDHRQGSRPLCCGVTIAKLVIRREYYDYADRNTRPEIRSAAFIDDDKAFPMMEARIHEIASRLHADRVAGCDRDHRGLDRLAAPRRAGGTRGGPPHAVHNNLKQLGLSLHNYHSSVNAFPPAGWIAPLTNWWVANNLTWPGHFRYSFMLQTLPYMEQTAASNAMNFNIPLYDINGDDMPQNTTVYSMQVTCLPLPERRAEFDRDRIRIAVQLRRMQW